MKQGHLILSLSVITILGACAETKPLAWDPSGNQRGPAQGALTNSTQTRITGTALRIMAIGGETTGMALEKADGEIVEIDFVNPSNARIFQEGRRLEVRGQFEPVRGVEIPVRDVLFVEFVRAL